MNRILTKLFGRLKRGLFTNLFLKILSTGIVCIPTCIVVGFLSLLGFFVLFWKKAFSSRGVVSPRINKRVRNKRARAMLGDLRPSCEWETSRSPRQLRFRLVILILKRLETVRLMQALKITRRSVCTGEVYHDHRKLRCFWLQAKPLVVGKVKSSILDQYFNCRTKDLPI